MLAGILSGRKLLWVIILLGIAVRLYRIDGPFPDWHYYRQFDTAAIARNFSEHSLNILYPQVDWGGNSRGYVEVEFQVFTFMVAVLYRVFGVHESLGRILNLFFYAGTALLLYRLARDVYGRRTALFAVGFYAFLPLSYSVSHNFQPDTFMVLCTLAGIYYFFRWTEDMQWKWLAISFAGLAIAVLIKPFCLYAGVPLIYLCHRKFAWRFLAKPVLWAYALLIVLPMVAWYIHAYHLWTIYGNTFGIFGGRVKGVYLGGDVATVGTLLHNLGWRLVWEIATPVGLLLLLAGLFVRPPSGNYVFHWWALGFLATIPAIPSGHSGHNYYQLPLVLIVAPAMAYGLVRLIDRGTLSWRMAGAVCGLFLAFCAWGIWPMIASSVELKQRIAFGKRVAALVPEDALIVFSYPLPYTPSWYSHRTPDGDLIGGDPTDFYDSHRKGWSLFGWQTSPEMLQKLTKYHAQYFATFYPKYVYAQSPQLKTFLETNATPIEVKGRWIIYRLSQPNVSSARVGGQ
jgi:4-amino-4-deoxy-L-arabinose transferase-like glycosyltransferase